jgi:hypothetical protein
MPLAKEPERWRLMAAAALGRGERRCWWDHGLRWYAESSPMIINERSQIAFDDCAIQSGFQDHCGNASG